MNIPHVLGYLSRVRDKTAGSVVLKLLLYHEKDGVSRRRAESGLDLALLF